MPKKELSTRMRYSTWERDFRPLKNTMRSHPGLDGYGFETFGDELDHVLTVANSEPERVWTVVDGDDGKWYIVNGYHYVNRIMYAITEVPCDRPDLNITYG